MAMGLRPLDLAHWIEIDDQRDVEIQLKKELVASRRDVVVATRSLGDDAARELRDELRNWMSTYAPAVGLEEQPDEHPVVEAAHWVQEDLCVLVKSDTWRLESACVCFPSRWDLATKIGTTLDAIHGPVPHYDTELSSPVNAFFDRITPERSFWRLNWTLLDDPTLHQSSVIRRPPSGQLSDWFFRVERQTLRRLPMTGAVVFTIRNYVRNAAQLAEQVEGFTDLLLTNIASAPPAMHEYKGWVGVAERLKNQR
jgi:dimethylamine monooxygenase subunit A